MIFENELEYLNVSYEICHYGKREKKKKKFNNCFIFFVGYILVSQFFFNILNETFRFILILVLDIILFCAYVST